MRRSISWHSGFVSERDRRRAGSILIVGLVTLAMTVAGGIAAVVYADVAAGALLIGGALTCSGHRPVPPVGGPMAVLDTAGTAENSAWAKCLFSWVMTTSGSSWWAAASGRCNAMRSTSILSKNTSSPERIDRPQFRRTFRGGGLSAGLAALLSFGRLSLGILSDQRAARMPAGRRRGEGQYRSVLHQDPIAGGSHRLGGGGADGGRDVESGFGSEQHGHGHCGRFLRAAAPGVSRIIRRLGWAASR